MSFELRVSAVWLALAAVLALLAFLDPFAGKGERSTALVFPELRDSRAVSLRLEEKGRSILHTRRSDGAFRLVFPERGHLNELAHRELLDAARLLRSARTTKGELSETRGTLEIEFENGTRRSLQFGEIVLEGQRQWVSSGSLRVLVERHLVETIFESARRSIEHGAPVEDQVISFTQDGSAVRLGPAFIDWGQGAHPTGSAALELRDSLDSLRRLPLAKEGSPGSPGLRIEWEGASYEEVGRCRGSHVLLATRAGLACAAASNWEELSAALAKPRSLVRRFLWSSKDPPARIEISGDKSAVLRSAELDPQALASWWRDLGGGAAAELEPGCPLAGRRFRVRTEDDEVHVLEEGGKLWACRQGEDVRFAHPGLRRDQFDELSRKLKPRGLIEEEPAMVKSVELRRAGHVYRLDGWPDSWTALRGPERPPNLLQERTLALAHLRALEYVEKTPTGWRESVKIEFADVFSGASTRYRIELWRDSSACYARLAPGPTARIDDKVCRLFSE